MSGFTEKEIVALNAFRKRVSDILPNDEFSQRDDFLIRYLRARELNLDKAEDMIRTSMQWRIDNKIDAILNAGVDAELLEKFPYYCDGIDKRGRPVITMAYGAWDIRSFIESEGTERFAHFSNQLLEKIMMEVKRRTFELEKNGNDENESSCVQFVAISDMAGYSYNQLANMKAVQSILQTVKNYEAYYPECMAQCIVINAPAVFSVLFGMMKPFMSGHTLDKIQIFPENKDKWQPAVLEVVESHQIREQFGGTKL